MSLGGCEGGELEHGEKEVASSSLNVRQFLNKVMSRLDGGWCVRDVYESV